MIIIILIYLNTRFMCYIKKKVEWIKTQANNSTVESRFIQDADCPGSFHQFCVNKLIIWKLNLPQLVNVMMHTERVILYFV